VGASYITGFLISLGAVMKAESLTSRGLKLVPGSVALRIFNLIAS